MTMMHELYTMKISRELEVEIESESDDPRDIANELWYRLTEGGDLEEVVDLTRSMYDNCDIKVVDDYISDSNDNAPMKLSGEIRWLPIREVPEISYSDGMLDCQPSWVLESKSTEVLLQGDSVLAIIYCDNNVWRGNVYVEDGYRIARDHKKPMKSEIDKFVQSYLYNY